MKEKFKYAPDEYMFHPLAESAQVRSDVGGGGEEEGGKAGRLLLHWWAMGRKILY